MNSTQLTSTIYPPPIDQSDRANSTGSEESMTPLQLEWSPDGWSGKNEHFRVVNNIIKIKKTDADISHIPTERQRNWNMDEEGIFSVYEEIKERDNHIYQLWMRKIAPYLADWVLGKSPNASPEWKLVKFPENYTLWVHKKGHDTDPANPRKDAYLYGAPRLGPASSRSYSTQLNPTIFRSPMEFVEHAIWLMKGGDTSGQQCRCQYCEPDQTQKEINQRLNREIIVIDDDDDDDNIENERDGPRDPVSVSLASRRRVATVAAGRGRRTTRRERSPPIMAKDYRIGVGNPDPGSGPGPSSAT